jgi:hypothetical protein
MTGESGSSRFRELFESALRDYEKTTNLTLAKHPFAEHLQNCHSVESIATFLQDKAREFGDFEGRNEMMKSIESTVSILCALSTTAALGDSVYLVCPKVPMRVYHLRLSFHSQLHLQKRHILPSPSYWLYVLSFRSYVRTLLTSKPIRRPRGSMAAMMTSSSCSNPSNDFSNPSKYILKSLPLPPQTI